MELMQDDPKIFLELLKELSFQTQREKKIPNEVLKQSVRDCFSFILKNTGCSSACKIASILIVLSFPERFPCQFDVKGFDPTRMVMVLHTIEFCMRGFDPISAFSHEEGVIMYKRLLALYGP